MKLNDITLLQRKRDAAKIYLRKNPNDKFAKLNYQTTIKACDKIIYIRRHNYLAEVAKENQPKKLWQTINKLKHKYHPTPSICPGNFNEFYCQTPNRLNNQPAVSTLDILNSIVYSDKKLKFTIQEVTQEEFKCSIKSLKNHKVDYTVISTKFIKTNSILE